MSIRCEKTDPRKLPSRGRQEARKRNRGQMAESKDETAMGAGS